MNLKSCVSCARLTTCHIVDADKLEKGYCCDSWARTSSSLLSARLQITKKFGPWALRYETIRLQTVDESAVPKIRRRHRNG